MVNYPCIFLQYLWKDTQETNHWLSLGKRMHQAGGLRWEVYPFIPSEFCNKYF